MTINVLYVHFHHTHTHTHTHTQRVKFVKFIGNIYTYIRNYVFTYVHSPEVPLDYWSSPQDHK